MFDPSSTARRIPAPPSNTLPITSCRNFTQNVLMPTWQSRADVLNYCATVATSDDPDDPDSLQRIAEREADKERVVDDRLDPYSGRFFPQESRAENLARLVRNERIVESIIRERSWRIVKDRCGENGVPGQDWETAFNEWRKSKGKNA
jgi:hypothetical protein